MGEMRVVMKKEEFTQEEEAQIMKRYNNLLRAVHECSGDRLKDAELEEAALDEVTETLTCAMAIAHHSRGLALSEFWEIFRGKVQEKVTYAISEIVT